MAELADIERLLRSTGASIRARPHFDGYELELGMHLYAGDTLEDLYNRVTSTALAELAIASHPSERQPA